MSKKITEDAICDYLENAGSPVPLETIKSEIIGSPSEIRFALKKLVNEKIIIRQRSLVDSRKTLYYMNRD